MTAEGYDYEYALTMISHDPAGYGTYSSTATTSHIEVTVDPPPWFSVTFDANECPAQLGRQRP